MLNDSLHRYGVKTKPVHLLYAKKSGHHAANVERHTHRMPLPARSLIALDKETLVVTPELLFLELASMSDIDDIELLRIGYELCGTYVLDPSCDSWDGFTNTSESLTSKRRILTFLERCTHLRGTARARKLARYLADGSNSPMETVTALIASLPHCMGGWGLGAIKMNQRVVTADGPKWVDILFVNTHVGLEYKGRRSHSLEHTMRDDRRQNRLTGTGITTFNIWYEDLAQERLCNRLMRDIARALHMRLRMRSQAYEARRRVLYASLLPSIQRFEHVGG